METQENTTSGVGVILQHRSRNWFFTWNNYEESDINLLIEYFGTETQFIFQEEVGDNGTKHLQGCFFFKNARTFGMIKNKLGEQIHLEILKNKKKAILYCSKRETRSGRVFQNMGIKIRETIKDEFEIEKIRIWQQQLLEIIQEEPDRRKVYWLWSSRGGTGKSIFARHLHLKYNAVVIDCGKSSDIKYALACWAEERDLKIIVLDYPRNMENRISYEVMECIKNGIFFSPKYESRQVVFNTPHLICFANFPPNLSALSDDRWEIIEIDE